MISVRALAKTLSGNTINSLTFPLIQPVRYVRKPRKPFWKGTAKSKQFYIPPQPHQTTEEKETLIKLHNIYKTARKSLSNYIVSENVGKEELLSKGVTTTTTEDCIKKSLQANEEWNAESALKREERLTKEKEKLDEISIQIMEKKDAIKQSITSKATQLIIAEKEKSKTYITRDNIDKAIEECLANTVDYNYAIDLDGNTFTTFENTVKTPPTPQENVTERAQKVVNQ